mmetsp:Transcript_5466/g.7062  ORF Transcript_5466/g.7062 Transcript_5466/m.7062 type:complete len:193 (-) Transcript_5466:157-735(-)|eukprot:CAMPEP_0201487800 /NCGR_PEP_ID=MMETSP0151_2-20130828/15376_1 /ASSEMBLY_ACC=CAM_ASM_000257 /TAXON_ID=200890 /ORGANISM="Paramoeba atlantica, Strain 621/1 / CCAP 1560/9" /LENGTH=192 /DNA_ID=CAMNT_0047872949 /DNA_START=167 /DNA_END=745 /DNA_ORIENTATION=-
MADVTASSTYEVVVMGSGGVGKSALTVRFVSGHFLEEYDPTIEDSYKRSFDVDGHVAMINVIDTAGQEEWHHLLDDYILSGQGFALVYSIVEQPSFTEIRSFYEKIERLKDDASIPLVICGNKKDLESSRAVTTERGAELAKELGGAFVEASAKTNHNVEEVFFNLVREIRKHRFPQGIPSKEKKRRGCAIL